MRQLVYFISFYSAVILFFGLIKYLLLRFAHRSWWSRRWIRRVAYAVPPIGILSLALIGFSEANELGWLTAVFAPLATFALILEMTLAFTLPFSAAINLINRLIDRLRKVPNTVVIPTVDRNRRLLLKGLAAAVPMAAVGTAASGFGRAFNGAAIVEKQFSYAGLPPTLDGLKLLQISDSHLRQYVTLKDLENLLGRAESFKPDLVLVTGDLADDLGQLPGALSLMDQLKPRLGSFASLGNHEHFRGLTRVRGIFDKSAVPLLVDQSVRLDVDGTPLVVAGIDDPVSMGSIREDFFDSSLDMALADRNSEEFTVLMSHRPSVFPYASSRKVDLTLAGHTHGGQMGWSGRSVWENHFPGNYLWGRYTLENRHLYTTCGMGHWFPFRLGCPCEAPLITLRSA